MTQPGNTGRRPPHGRQLALEVPVSAPADPIARLRAVGNILARRGPGVLAAATALLESVLQATDQHSAADQMPTTPGVLTAKQVLDAARAGVPAFAGAAGDQMILLATLGLDLTRRKIRAALVQMHERRELRLVRLDRVRAAARADLAARGLRVDLIKESAIGHGQMTFHAVVVRAARADAK